MSTMKGMKESAPKLKGHLHPISQMIEEINLIFSKMGFSFVEGPEIETEYYNFDALNIPQWHPSRDMWDTFWLKPQNARKLLRTHTSPVQIRYMEKHTPPFAIIAPGKVYRHEATDATHEAQFYQLEGLMIGKDISLATMKGILEKFFSEFFGRELKARLRPSYFPFTEPSVEVDMTCIRCNGVGCATCKGTGFIEFMGAGMVHHKVLEAVGIHPREWQGFAFGAGIDRLAMMKYGIDDVRLLYTGDLRLVNQF
jgi:phenylalanyl-tRNA synthetase alpha chain